MFEAILFVSLTLHTCTHHTLQRHWIRIVPVSEVACTWKGKSFNYWVYGYNTLVYDPDYPQKMCWGCTLF